MRTLYLTFLAASCLAAAPDPLLFRATFDDTADAATPAGAVKPLQVFGRAEYRDGKFGRALVVGGDGAQVTYPMAGNVRPSQGTISMWVNPIDWPADEQAFHIFFETEGPGWLVLYKFWNGGLLFLSGTDHAHYSSAFWVPGALGPGWHHLAGTWEQRRLRFYLDGVKQAESALPGLPPELTGWFRIGDEGWVKPHTSHTLIDDARVYRWALPPEQIRRLADGQEVDWRPSLPTQVLPRAAREQWIVSCDASGYLRPDGAGTRVDAEVIAAGRQVAGATTSEFRDSVATLEVPPGKVPAGKHTVRIKVKDAAGGDVASAEVPFEKPGKPPWWHNREGMANKVLPPFTPLVTDRAARSVGCWGRTYRLDGLLPGQIESQGQPLLAGPMRLTVNGVEAPPGTLNWDAAGPTRATFLAAAETVAGLLTCEERIEYDGLYWAELRLRPAKAPYELREVTLRIPLRAEAATLLHRFTNWVDTTAGSLPAEGWSSPGPPTYVWLGNEDRGLAWFAESSRGWSTANGQPAVSVERKGGVVELVLHVVNQPTALKGAWSIRFGLQATPVKPLPAERFTWRLGNLGTADNLNDPSMGNLQVIWCNGNLAHYGYPWPKDPERFRTLVSDLHAKGVKVLPYVNLNMLSTEAPDFDYYSPDFIDPARNFSTGDVGQMGGPILGACPAIPEWRDLIAWRFARFVDEFQVDGLYIDCWNPSPCVTASHGCAWSDAAGQHGTAPILGMREVLRRVREILADRRPSFHVICHMSTTVSIPTLSFADSMLDGEQYQAPTLDPTDDYLNIIPLDKWRTENCVTTWGVYPFFLPEFGGANRHNLEATNRLNGLLMLHGASPWPIWCDPEPIFDTWKACDRFGVADVTFVPYWKPNGVAVDPPDIKVTVYRRPGKALLAVVNTAAEPRHVVVRPDAAMLGLKKGWGASEPRTEMAMAVTDGSLALELPARGFVLLELR
ncbi:MAG: LamG domain-containing protein [Armatimonadetes bacterium]|nr:LamG domain-containing protein [Armatimonadota bacterium]